MKYDLFSIFSRHVAPISSNTNTYTNFIGVYGRGASDCYTTGFSLELVKEDGTGRVTKVLANQTVSSWLSITSMHILSLCFFWLIYLCHTCGLPHMLIGFDVRAKLSLSGGPVGTRTHWQPKTSSGVQILHSSHKKPAILPTVTQHALPF